MQQCLFEFGIAARESLNIVQTVCLHGITERGVLPVSLLTDSREPLEAKLHFEAVAFTGLHQVLLIQKPSDERGIEPPIASPVGLDPGRVGGRISLNFFLR